MQLVQKTIQILNNIKNLRKKGDDIIDSFNNNSPPIIVMLSLLSSGALVSLIANFSTTFFEPYRQIIGWGCILMFPLFCGGIGYSLNSFYLKKKDVLFNFYGLDKLTQEKNHLLEDLFENKQNLYELMKEIYSFSEKTNENIQLEISVLIKQLKEAYVKKDEKLLENTLREFFRFHNNPPATNFEEAFHQNFTQIAEIEQEIGQNNLNVNKYL